MISVGDKELDSNGNLRGEILILGEFSPYAYEFDIGPAQKLIIKDPLLQQVRVTLKINSLIKGKNIYYKDRQILEGSSLEFSSAKYSVEAEEVTIVKDKDSAVIDLRVEDAGIKDEQFDTLKKEIDTISKEVNALNQEFKSQLNNLGQKLESSLEQMRKEVNSIKDNKSKKKRIW